MTPTETANWLAFGGLVFLVCSASITFAFGLGRVFQRVGDLRAEVNALKAGEAEDSRSHASLREAFARFEGRIETKLEHLDGRVADLALSLAQAPGPPYIPRARRPKLEEEPTP